MYVRFCWSCLMGGDWLLLTHIMLSVKPIRPYLIDSIATRHGHRLRHLEKQSVYRLDRWGAQKWAISILAVVASCIKIWCVLARRFAMGIFFTILLCSARCR